MLGRPPTLVCWTAAFGGNPGSATGRGHLEKAIDLLPIATPCSVMLHVRSFLTCVFRMLDRFGTPPKNIDKPHYQFKLKSGSIGVYVANARSHGRRNGVQTISMQGIADLARVKRPVVSMWRTRFAPSESPFPSPLQEAPLLFDAAKVAQWLQETGHGNNAHPVDEFALHSSAMQLLAQNLDDASALLLLQELSGELLQEVDPVDAVVALEAHQVDSVLDPSAAMKALGDDKLCAAVDELAEAAFSGSQVLDRLVEKFAKPGGPWADEALTSAGVELLGRVIAELQRIEPRTIAPAGPGGLVAISELPRHAGETDCWTFEYRSAESPAARAAWRRLAAHGLCVEGHDRSADAKPSPSGVLYVMQWQDVSAGPQFFDRVEDMLIDMGDRDILVVIGPANLMTDRQGDGRRRKLLIPSESYVAPLRYVARLPNGLSKFGGRRRLALWVFGRATSSWTVAGSHSDSRIDVAALTAIAADVAAAISDSRDLHAHAFHSSSVLESSYLLRQPELVAPSASGTPNNGDEQLARVWELDQGFLDDVELSAAPAQQAQISLARATRELGRDMAGARLPGDILGSPEPGWAIVIGPDEVRDPALIGRRGIDRLTLEVQAPRAQLTQPGDVIYVATGGPAAVVDQHGGHVVMAPARIFRCRDAETDDRQLVPAVVAADIAAQRGSDRSTWRLRTVPASVVAPLHVITQRTYRRRQRLLDELKCLDEFETEVLGGLSAGSLTASISQSNTKKAER